MSATAGAGRVQQTRPKKDSHLLRVSIPTYHKLRAIAESESRPMNWQLDLILDEWLETHGYTVDGLGVPVTRAS